MSFRNPCEVYGSLNYEKGVYRADRLPLGRELIFGQDENWEDSILVSWTRKTRESPVSHFVY